MFEIGTRIGSLFFACTCDWSGLNLDTCSQLAAKPRSDEPLECLCSLAAFMESTKLVHLLRKVVYTTLPISSRGTYRPPGCPTHLRAVTLLLLLLFAPFRTICVQQVRIPAARLAEVNRD